MADNNSFTKEIEKEQRITFMVVIAYLGRIDGELNEERFYDLAMTHNLSEDEMAAAHYEQSEDEVLSLLFHIQNPSLALVLIRELFYFGYDDGDLSDEKILFISKVGQALNIPIEKMEQISEWVIKGIEWEEEGAKIFSVTED